MIPWDEVTLDQGTGVVHIAPGCGGEDFELSKVHNLDVLTPVDEAGRFYDDYGWLHGLSTVEAADQLIGNLGERGLLVESGLYEHAYPHCWRCDTPLIFRLSDDWFISVEELRPQLLAANQDVEWTPAYMGKRMDDWLNNMGDWNISRRRYYGLPLPFYPCSCGHLNVIGSRAELEERATEGLDQLEELRRPWIDEVPIRCESCGEPVRRVVEVGDVWLDAGIVPFSTLGWQNPTFVPQGYATGAAKGLTTADLHDHAYWEEWFPADWVSEMREQIRLWFYSQHFMSVVLTGRAPYRKVLGYEKMLDETGREMHGSWGNMIEAEDAFERMGADVMRWQFCAQPPDRNLLFGFGPGREIQRKLLTLWNSARFLADYGRIEHFRPEWGAQPSRARPASARPLAARADECARARGDRGLRGVPDGRRDAGLRGVRRRSLELVHPPLAAPLLGRRPDALCTCSGSHSCNHSAWSRRSCRSSPSISGMRSCAMRPEARRSQSTSRAGRRRRLPDEDLLAEVAEVRRVVARGHQARAASGLKLRQPLRRLVVEGAPLARGHVDELREELRVKEVEFGHVEATELHVKPHLPALGPKLGKELGAVRAALAAGEFEVLAGGGFRVLGHDLAADEVLVERSGKQGWAVVSEEGVTVALDTEPRRGARARGPCLRPRSHAQLDAQAAGARADRPDRRHPSDGRLRSRRAARRVDQGRGARRLARDGRRRRAAHREGRALRPPPDRLD